MNKVIQRKVHGTFGRVTAFLLAFVMALSLLPVFTGTTVVKAASSSTLWVYEDDGMSGLPAEWGVTYTAEDVLTGDSSRKGTFEESILSGGTNIVAGRTGVNVYTQTTPKKSIVFSPTVSGTFELFCIRTGGTTPTLRFYTVSEEKTSTVTMLSEIKGGGRDDTNIKPISYHANANEAFAFYSNSSAVALMAIRFTPDAEASDITVSASNGTVTASVEGEEVTGAVEGAEVTLTVTPDEGYELANDSDLTVTYGADSTSVALTKNTDGTYTFTMPGEAVTVTAAFTEIPKNTVTVAAVSNGSVAAYVTVDGVETAVGSNTVMRDTVVTLKATADEGYGLASVEVKDGNNADVEVIDNTFVMPASAVTVTPSFVNAQYDITINPAANGSVTADSTQNITVGKKVALNITPDAGYSVESVSVVNDTTKQEVSVGEDYSFTMPLSNVTVTVTFTLTTYAVITDVSNGTVTLTTSNGEIQSGDKLVPGTEVSIAPAPNEGYVLKSVTVTKTDDADTVVSISDEYKFTVPEYDVTVTVKFKSTEPTVRTWKSTDNTTAAGFVNVLNTKISAGAAKGYSKGLKMDGAGILKFTVTEGKYATVTVGILGNGNTYTPASLGIATDYTLTNGKFTSAIYIKDPSDESKNLAVTTTKPYGSDTEPQEFIFSGHLEGGTYFLLREANYQPVLYYVTIKEYDDPDDIPVVEEAAKVSVSGTITSEFDLTDATVTLTGDTISTGTVTNNGNGTYAYTVNEVVSGADYTISVASDSLLKAPVYIDSYSVSSITVGEQAVSDADFAITNKDITNTWDFTLGKYEVATIQKAAGTYKGLVIDATDTATYSDPKFAVSSNRVQVIPAVKITIPVENYAPGTVTVTFSGKASFTLGTSDNTSNTYSFDADTKTVELITTGSNSSYLTKIEITKSTEPEKPTEPEQPTEPDKPTEPEQPTEPDKPTEPEQPTEPDKPTEPEKPVDTDSVKAFVGRLYALALGREADEAGLEAWTNVLASGESNSVDVGFGFIFSSESIDRNLSNEDFIELLYMTFMDRPSDEAGKQAWLSQLAAGVDREKIFEGFVMSDEFKGICGNFGVQLGAVEDVPALEAAVILYRNQNADVTKFVSRCYTEILGRTPDVEGLENWCRVIITREDTPRNVAANGFIFSDTFQARDVSNEEYVRILYRTFMDREADSYGLEEWVNTLVNGAENRETIIDGFVNSPEFQEILAGFELD